MSFVEGVIGTEVLWNLEEFGIHLMTQLSDTVIAPNFLFISIINYVMICDSKESAPSF